MNMVSFARAPLRGLHALHTATVGPSQPLPHSALTLRLLFLFLSPRSRPLNVCKHTFTAKCAAACSPARCCNPTTMTGMTGTCMTAGNCNSYSACGALLVAVQPQCVAVPKGAVAPSSGVYLPKGDTTGATAATYKKGSIAPEDGGTFCAFCLVVEAGQVRKPVFRV